MNEIFVLCVVNDWYSLNVDDFLRYLYTESIRPWIDSVDYWTIKQLIRICSTWTLFFKS